ncbi:MAG: NADH-quinone oxidoreductase subunit N [Bacteroidia bacterium]|nr:NADH-quinone oxidoreductase subunit N [Bacteroidia bacterium]
MGDFLAQLAPDLALLAPELVLLGGICLLLLVELGLGRRRPGLVWALALGVVLADGLALALQVGQSAHVVLTGTLRVAPATTYLKLLAAGAALLWLWAAPESKLLKTRGVGAGEAWVLSLGLLWGVQLLVQAQNLVLVYLALELVSICSYVLVAYSRAPGPSAEAATKYLLYGGFTSALMLYGFSLLFGLSGSLQLLPEVYAAAPALQLGVATGLALAGAFFKLAAAPLHFWAPDVYSGAPTWVVGLLATLPKIGAMGLLYHLAVGLAPGLGATWPLLLTGVILLSWSLGNLLALQQTHFLRLLAYSSVSQAGFLLLGPALNTPTGWAAAFFYTGVYVVLQLGAVAAASYYERCSGTLVFEQWRGLGRSGWGWALALGITLVGLVGLPPTAGFTGKLTLLLPLWSAYTTTGAGLYLVLLVGAVVFTVVGLAYYLKPLRALAQGGGEGRTDAFVPKLALVVALTAGVTLALGLLFFDTCVAWLTQVMP